MDFFFLLPNVYHSALFSYKNCSFATIILFNSLLVFLVLWATPSNQIIYPTRKDEWKLTLKFD